MVFKATSPETTAVLLTAGPEQVGKLRVSDGYAVSPSVPFTFSLTDTIGPVISFIDELYQRSGDTIITADSTFFFTLGIKDLGSQGVAEASIDGKKFDIINDTLYTMIYPRMDTVRAPRRIVLKAVDNFLYRNDTTMTLFLLFDPAAAKKSGMRLQITVPHIDDAVYTTSKCQLLGRIEQIAGDTFQAQLVIRVNGTVCDTFTIAGKRSGEWLRTIPLAPNLNTVAVTACDKAGDSVAGVQRRIFYKEELADSLPPQIVSVKIDDEDANGRMFEKQEVVVRIMAFDPGTGIATVTVNGTAAVPLPGNNLVWEAPLTIAHRIEGIRVDIRVLDNQGLAQDTSIVVYTNYKPVIQHAPRPPFPFLLGQTLTDSIIVRDPDGDSVRFTLVTGDTSMQISGNGAIRWTPGKKHEGNNLFVFRIFDGYEQVLLPLNVVVVAGENLAPQVKWLTGLDDFPKWLEAGVDTLSVPLLTAPGTGMPPFTFKATDLSGTRIASVINDTLFFIPTINDTGRVQFRLTVTDTFERSDTLYPPVTVVPPNRQCFLRRLSPPGTLLGGIYNLSHYRDTVVLSFKIDDPDIDQAEIFYASVRRLGMTEQLVVNRDRTISVPLASVEKDSGYDTMLVLISDRADHRDSLTLVVYYGTAPLQPVLQWPLYDTVTVGSSVYYSWSGNDPDGYCTFTILAGKCPGPLETLGRNLPDRWMNIDGVKKSGRYCWQVVATDGKTTVSSKVGTYNLRVPDHVQFAVNEAEIPSVYEALRDTIAISLAVASGTGHAPFVYNAQLAEPVRPVTVSGGFLRYLPQLADTGMQKLRITVDDDAGNSDTLAASIYIAPVNRPCSLAVFYRGIFHSDPAIDLSGSMTPDTVVFKVIDPDTSLIERHVVTIHQLNIQTTGMIDNNRSISIVLDPQKSENVRDTVTVHIEDRAGHTASEKRVIFYGIR